MDFTLFLIKLGMSYNGSKYQKKNVSFSTTYPETKINMQEEQTKNIISLFVIMVDG